MPRGRPKCPPADNADKHFANHYVKGGDTENRSRSTPPRPAPGAAGGPILPPWLHVALIAAPLLLIAALFGLLLATVGLATADRLSTGMALLLGGLAMEMGSRRAPSC